MSAEDYAQYLRYRRTIRALREQAELREVLGVRPGESILDAAKRMQAQNKRLKKRAVTK